jgi:DNA-binding HxlR family transcriptional regulator
MIKVNEKEYNCPFEVSIDIMDGKWKLYILWHLRQKTRRFSELKRRIPGITQKMLTQKLRELEQERIITRKVYAEVPPRVEYSLTRFGNELEPIMEMLLEWGHYYSKAYGETDYSYECRPKNDRLMAIAK